ncbi:MAG: YitT family protein [Chloroflexi bacterium]|nr:YitT family protein [Chloroflexota bacterium]MDA0245983.1 YitT family protein [Chloroflexota bacterium]
MKKNKPKLSWREWGRSRFVRAAERAFFILLGTVVMALGYVLFQVPFGIAAGGLGGISIIINHYTGWPVGLTYWVLNIPMLLLGFYYLGRWPFVGRTLIAASLFATFTDLLTYFLPPLLDTWPITNDVLLSSIYGGIVGGVGGGLVYRAGATGGGTAVLARVVQLKTGWPLSQIYLMDDGIIIIMLGVVFGWENALYALLMLFINGMASDYLLEGASTTRTATIVTNRPKEVTEALLSTLKRGVTSWEVTGGYTGQKRHMLMCTMSRAQMNDVKTAVADADPEAFVTIGVSHFALGAGFSPLKKSEK